MKTLLITGISTILCHFTLTAQIIVQGISPSPIANAYNFMWADPAGADWSCPDFNVQGTFVQDTLMLAEDGTLGTSPNGHDLSNEACNTVMNDLSGKIAVVYRGSCEFSLKALNAQTAGAVGVILINTDNTLIGLGGGTYGLGVNIPVVMLNQADGSALVNEMQTGSVVVFMGNQIGASSNDVGCIENEVLITPYGGGLQQTYDGFELGLIVYNYGSNVQNNITVNAQITGPAGVMYDQTIGPLSIATGANESLLPGSTNAFPIFDLGLGSYPIGNYTLTYTLDMGVPDEFPLDNIRSYDFSINNKGLSYSRADANGQPLATGYPSNSTSEYQSCAMIQDDNFNGREVGGMYFIPHADTNTFNPVGSEIFGNLYQWDDAWTDLNDPNYQFDPSTNDAFQNLNLLTFGIHYINQQNEVDQVAYVPFGTAAPLQNGIRYLFCLQSFEPNLSFGYDDALNYTANVANTAQPVAPVLVDGSWYVNGWLGFTAPSIALDLDTNCSATQVTQLYATNSCLGQNSGELAIQISGFSSPSILWDNGGFTDTLTGLAAGTYSAVISDTNNCSGSISVIIEEVELIAISQTQDESCDGNLDGSISITSVADGTFPLTYQWDNGDTTATITGLDDGNYSVTITDAFGCQTTENFNINSTIPDFGLNISATPDWGAAPMQVTFNNSTPNFPLYDFTWYFGDGNSVQTNGTSVQHTYATDGTWDVSLVAVDQNTGCMDSVSFNSLVVTNSIVGLEELGITKEVVISPNPSEGNVRIVAMAFTGQIHIEILNIEGQPIYQRTSDKMSNDVDLSFLASGMYLVKVSDESSQVIQRLIKK